MSRYLVTGGCGFVGRHLIHALVAKGHGVTVLDDLSSGEANALPKGARLIQADICDNSALAQAMEGVQGVFHLAAISSVEACSRDRSGTHRVNFHGTSAVLKAAQSRPVVFTSSAAVYGDQPVLPVSEAAILRPISPYADDKRASEDLLAASGLPAIALRPFNVYGPGQSAQSPYSGVITRFVARARAGPSLRINGDGSQTRDFIHVADVARALVAAMTRAEAATPGCEIVNVCRGDAISVLDLARTIQKLMDVSAPMVFAPARPGDIAHSLGDPSRAASILRVRAEIGMDAGLADLLGVPQASRALG